MHLWPAQFFLGHIMAERTLDHLRAGNQHGGILRHYGEM